MAINAKAIKQRIKSVTNTQKMTRAMEMVSAAKMRKATEAADNTRLYATLAHELMKKLSDLDDPNFPLLQMRPVENVLVVLISSNRGLCGSYNSNVFKRTQQVLMNDELIAQHHINGGRELPVRKENPNIHVIGIGKKSAQFAKKHGYNLVGVYDNISENPTFDEILPITRQAIDGYIAGTYDRVIVAYTSFITTLHQEVKIRQLMPISPKDLAKMINESGALDRKRAELEEEALGTGDNPIMNYTFEPNLEAIVDYVLPKLVEIQTYEAVLESAASEHSSRMIAMKNATDNAGDMVKELTLTYNKARQAAITQEIAEIVGGAAALE